MYGPHRTYFSDREGQPFFRKNRSWLGDLLLVVVSLALGATAGVVTLGLPLLQAQVQEAMLQSRDPEYKRLVEALVAQKKKLVEDLVAEKEKLAKEQAAKRGMKESDS